MFSVAMTVYQPDQAVLRLAVASVFDQVYPHWELCIADDASTDPAVAAYLQTLARDPRIKLVLRPENGHISAATNSAVALAGGEFVVLLDHDDALAPEALAELALYVAEHAQTDLLYSDSDKIDTEGRRTHPHFKPDFSPEMLLSYMYAGQTLCVRTSLWRRLGGMRLGYEGSQDHDFALRASELARHVGHIPLVLYHWRASPQSTASSGAAKPYSFEAGRQAVQDALTRRGSPGCAQHLEWARRIDNGIFGAAFPDRGPRVTVLIVSHGGEPLRRTIASLRMTRYETYEIVVLDASDAGGFSRLVNEGARNAAGDYLVLLADDVECVDASWLGSMVGFAQLEGVGAVGGLLHRADGTVEQAGIVQTNRVPVPIALAFEGADPSDAGYLAMTRYVRNTGAVTADCLLVSRALFLEAGGLDAARFGAAYHDADLCYRLSDRGLRHVYDPAAAFRRQQGSAPRLERPAELASFVARYRGRTDPYLNPNLCGDPSRFQIQPRVTPTRQPTPLRVVFCSHNLNLEGAPKALFDICTQLERMGQIEPLVYSPREGALRQAYEREGVKVIVRPSPLDRGGELPQYLAGLQEMRQVFADWNADIVVANTLQTFYAIDAASEAGIPSVWNVHESDGWRGYYDDLAQEVERRALACFGHPYRVVYVAEATRLVYAELDFNHNATVIAGGIDAAALTSDLGSDTRARARRRLRIDPARTVLLTVGTIHPRKGQLDLVEAFEQLGLDADAMLLIVGDAGGDYSVALHDRVEAMPPSMRARVVVVAERDDIGTYYAAADLFIFCSRRESYPRVIMEAMAFGLPIITTPVDGIPEQVTDGVNARFYQPGDIAGLARHIGDFMADAPLREAFGQRSRQTLATLNTASDVAAAHGTLLREAALSSVPPSRLAEFESVPKADQNPADLRRMEVRKWRL